MSDSILRVLPLDGGPMRTIDLGAPGARGVTIHPSGTKLEFVALTAPVTRELWVLDNFLMRRERR